MRQIYAQLKSKLLGRKHTFPTVPAITKYAFTCGGVDYYQLDDLFNIPYQRGMEAIHAYEELEMRCDKTYLLQHAGLINEILTGTKIGLPELQQIKAANDQLRQRLTWVVLPEQAYRLASIVYFDASENPLKYEVGYAKKKIAHWRASSDASAFFLQQPLQTLIPFLSGFEGNFQTYSDLVERVHLQHLKNLSTKFSKSSGAQPIETQ
jgi:hypothetical protein